LRISTSCASTSNYINISKTLRATATRDLQDLVEKGVLIKIGELRHTRYFLNLNERSES
jgi:Fic family protein